MMNYLPAFLLLAFVPIAALLIIDRYQTRWKWQFGATPSSKTNWRENQLYWSWCAEKLESENADEAMILEFFEREFHIVYGELENLLFEVFSESVRASALRDLYRRLLQNKSARSLV